MFLSNTCRKTVYPIMLMLGIYGITSFFVTNAYAQTLRPYGENGSTSSSTFNVDNLTYAESLNQILDAESHGIQLVDPIEPVLDQNSYYWQLQPNTPTEVILENVEIPAWYTRDEVDYSLERLNKWQNLRIQLFRDNFYEKDIFADEQFKLQPLYNQSLDKLFDLSDPEWEFTN